MPNIFRLFTTKKNKRPDPAPTETKKDKKKKKQAKAKRRVAGLCTKLYQLGFAQTALAELKSLAEDDTNSYLQKLAAWKAALYYAGEQTHEAARLCLRYLLLATTKEKSSARLREALILEAECYKTLENNEAGAFVLQRALKAKPHSEYYLAAANFAQTLEEKERLLNSALQLQKLSAVALNEKDNYLLPQGGQAAKANAIEPVDPAAPTVSVILPVYNSEKLLPSVLASLLAQSWSVHEIIVVDDCSSDGSADIAAEYAKKDSRIKVLQTDTNSGRYVAQNLALSQASGEFVTCHLDKEIAHPQKIEVQVRHLLKNPQVVANTSQQVCISPQGHFRRVENSAHYLSVNPASLMFRRQTVLASLGYWDSVRHGGDLEFIIRLQKKLGEEAIVDLQKGPLSFVLEAVLAKEQAAAKVTAKWATAEYLHSLEYFHEELPALHIDFPQAMRPFPAPEPLWPKRDKKRHFDVIIASEFRLPGGTTMSNMEEIKAQTRLGLKTGLVQLAQYSLNPERNINTRIRQLQNDKTVSLITSDEKVSCDLLIIKYPLVLQNIQDHIPHIQAKEIRVVANQTPMSEYGPQGVFCYDLRDCERQLQKSFGKSATWHPIGPLIRETIATQHAQELAQIKISADDWVELIDVAEWRRPQHTPGNKIVLGRHSRDGYVKWPANPDDLLAIYPPADDFQIMILGGAQAPQKTLGSLPANWQVWEFGALHPREFLQKLDVFVYFIHPDLVEAFGRVILEAMAVGVPVILPHKFSDLFGEAALYAYPLEVKAKVYQLVNDEAYYEEQVEKALLYIDNNFGYAQHKQRLAKIAAEHNLPLLEKLKNI